MLMFFKKKRELLLGSVIYTGFLPNRTFSQAVVLRLSLTRVNLINKCSFTDSFLPSWH